MKTQALKGMRDLLPAEQTLRDYIQGKILETYDYLPMLQDAGQQLLTQQMFYVTDEYNAMLGYGGLAYTKYNYTDAEWTAYVAEQGGELKY